MSNHAPEEADPSLGPASWLPPTKELYVLYGPYIGRRIMGSYDWRGEHVQVRKKDGSVISYIRDWIGNYLEEDKWPEL